MLFDSTARDCNRGKAGYIESCLLIENKVCLSSLLLYVLYLSIHFSVLFLFRVKIQFILLSVICTYVKWMWVMLLTFHLKGFNLCVLSLLLRLSSNNVFRLSTFNFQLLQFSFFVCFSPFFLLLECYPSAFQFKTLLPTFSSNIFFQCTAKTNFLPGGKIWGNLSEILVPCLKKIPQ